MAKLLMYDSSAKPVGEKVTLPEYINRMQDTQKDIFYLAAPSRELAESSPYFEALKVSCGPFRGTKLTRVDSECSLIVNYILCLEHIPWLKY